MNIGCTALALALCLQPYPAAAQCDEAGLWSNATCAGQLAPVPPLAQHVTDDGTYRLRFRFDYVKTISAAFELRRHQYPADDNLKGERRRLLASWSFYVRF